MNVTFEFTAHLLAQPQGSSRGFNRDGRVVITSDNPKLKKYRTALAKEARAATGGSLIMREFPVSLDVTFGFKRPKSVKRSLHTVRPDLDKLVRAVGDSLTGVLYEDDSQVNEITARKEYAEEDFVRVRVTT